MSAQVHDTDALSRALYPPQLRLDDAVTLNLDHRVTGVGETPNKTHPKYRVLPGPHEYTVWLAPIPSGRVVAGGRTRVARQDAVRRDSSLVRRPSSLAVGDRP